jgi:adenylate cyclase
MESILKSEDQIKLSGERRKITVLFSDIRNFTSFSEKYPAEQVVSMLNEYFSGMVEIIFRNQGILDKFLGDGIMVEFGVPLDDPEQELNAVKTAMEMRTELARLCAKWESEGLPAIDIGIGIHTGEAVIGNIGSEKRIEYTAIGDAVNVAARIEQLTKELKTPVLISETTIVAIRDKFDFKDFGAQTIRGRVETINVYGIN